MTNLIAEINVECKDFEQFKQLDLWVTQAFDIVAKHPNLKIVPIGNIGLLLCDDQKIKQLNHQFRNKNQATNVLSFPTEPDEFDALFEADEDEVYLGDIAMAYETLTTEATAQNKSLGHHFIHLLIHSILHLLGYDHIEQNEADQMENLEIEFLAMLNIENPYG